MNADTATMQVAAAHHVAAVDVVADAICIKRGQVPGAKLPCLGAPLPQGQIQLRQREGSGGAGWLTFLTRSVEPPHPRWRRSVRTQPIFLPVRIGGRRCRAVKSATKEAGFSQCGTDAADARTERPPSHMDVAAGAVG